MTAGWELIRPGGLTTVQDLGRPGRLREGIPPAGAMDRFALQVGNLLCDNPRGAAALEMALGGLVIRALSDHTVALTGADTEAVLDGNRLPAWQTVRVQAGQTIACGAPKAGAWSYLCCAGGIDVPPVLDSRSTCLSAQFGGLNGRGLIVGDRLPIGPVAVLPPSGRGLSWSERPTYAAAFTARVVRGPQDDRFDDAAWRTFLSATYTISPQSNRMGYRLEGSAIAPRSGYADLLSEAAAAGAIQVPGGGKPIVLLNDRPATGGYPKIATVISADLSAVTQLRPGGRLGFQEIDIAAAQAAATHAENVLAEIGRGCNLPVAPASSQTRL